MPTSVRQWIVWVPRVLGLLMTGFLALFALDAFTEGSGLAAFGAFVIHLVPALVVLAVALVSWRYPGLGALDIHRAGGAVCVGCPSASRLDPRDFGSVDAARAAASLDLAAGTRTGLEIRGVDHDRHQERSRRNRLWRSVGRRSQLRTQYCAPVRSETSRPPRHAEPLFQVAPRDCVQGTPTYPAGAQEQIEASRQQTEALLTDDDWRSLRATVVTMTHTSPAAAIVDYARAERIDLIVVGTHGRGPMTHLVMGSVAEHVVGPRSMPGPDGPASSARVRRCRRSRSRYPGAAEHLGEPPARLPLPGCAPLTVLSTAFPSSSSCSRRRQPVPRASAGRS